MLLVGYIIENKLLRGIIRQVKSILMNMQEISANSTADERQITDFSSAKCEKGRLIHEFSRRPAAMCVCDACGTFYSRPAPSQEYSPAPCPSTAVRVARTFILVYPLFPGDVNCASLAMGWLTSPRGPRGRNVKLRTETSNPMIAPPEDSVESFEMSYNFCKNLIVPTIHP